MIQFIERTIILRGSVELNKIKFDSVNGLSDAELKMLKHSINSVNVFISDVILDKLKSVEQSKEFIVTLKAKEHHCEYTSVLLDMRKVREVNLQTTGFKPLNFRVSL